MSQLGNVGCLCWLHEFPDLEEMNDRLKRLLKGVELSLSCPEDATTKELRDGLHSLLNSCWEVVTKINEELRRSFKRVKLVQVNTPAVTPTQNAPIARDAEEVLTVDGVCLFFLNQVGIMLSGSTQLD